MIARIDEVLIDFFTTEISEGGVSLPDFDVDIKIPSKSWSDALSDKTKVNLYLFDLRENTELRQNEWEERLTPEGKVERRRPEVRIDLLYMVTTYCSHFSVDFQNELTEHRLLSLALGAVHKHARIPQSYFDGFSPVPQIPIEALHPKFLDEQGGFQIWSALEQQPRPALFLKVTVPLELHQALSDAAVFTKSLDFTDSGRHMDMGGIVIDAGKNPVADADVTLRDADETLRDTVRSDAAGRFLFRGVADALCTISVSAAGYATSEPVSITPSEAQSSALIVQLSKL